MSYLAAGTHKHSITRLQAPEGRHTINKRPNNTHSNPQGSTDVFSLSWNVQVLLRLFCLLYIFIHPLMYLSTVVLHQILLRTTFYTHYCNNLYSRDAELNVQHVPTLLLYDQWSFQKMLRTLKQEWDSTASFVTQLKGSSNCLKPSMNSNNYILSHIMPIIKKNMKNIYKKGIANYTM